MFIIIYLSLGCTHKRDLLLPALDSGSWGWAGHSVSSLQILRALYAVDDQSYTWGRNEWVKFTEFLYL